MESGGTGDALVVAVWGFLGIVATSLTAILVQLIKSWFERRAASPVAPDSSLASVVWRVVRDQGVHGQRLDDSDERDEVQDRALHNHGDRLEAIERHLDRTAPDWRR